MFSMMPRTGTSTLRNMFSPLRASSRAMSWGVDTMGRACQRHVLRHGQLGVAGARRHVDDQDVQLAPGDVAQHLLQGAHAPSARARSSGVLRHQEADGHALDAVVAHRHQGLAVGELRLAGDAQHARLGRAVDVGVQQADRLRRAASASARLTAVVDLPTPPLPLATAMIALTPGTGAGAEAAGGGAGRLLLRCAGPGAPGRAARGRSLRRAVRTAVTEDARTAPSTACSAALRSGSIGGRPAPDRPRWRSRRCRPCTAGPKPCPAATTSWPLSGSMTVFSASRRTWCCSAMVDLHP